MENLKTALTKKSGQWDTHSYTKAKPQTSFFN